MKTIRWHKRAKKQLRRIGDLKTRDKIYNAVDSLKAFPNCQNIKKLTNRNDYRLRVGRYRIIFSIDLVIINIEEVKKRDERTY